MTTKELTPQDKAINHSLPIQCYEIHEYEGQIYGSVIDWIPAFEATKRYNHSFDIRGKAAHFIIVTDDAAILRREAISFAVALYEKKYVLHRIDTSGLGHVGRKER